MRKPMVIDADGEVMEATATDPSDPYYKVQSDANILQSGTIGVHRRCEGWIDLKVGTKVNAILCLKCGLRVVVPKYLKTFADLRAFLEQK